MDVSRETNAKQLIITDDEEEEVIQCGGRSAVACRKQLVLSEAETESDAGDETATDEEDDAVAVKRAPVDENAVPKQKAQSINVDNEVFMGPVSLAERIVSKRIGGRRRATMEDIDTPKAFKKATSRLSPAADASPAPVGDSITVDNTVHADDLEVSDAADINNCTEEPPISTEEPCEEPQPESAASASADEQATEPAGDVVEQAPASDVDESNEAPLEEFDESLTTDAVEDAPSDSQTTAECDAAADMVVTVDEKDTEAQEEEQEEKEDTKEDEEITVEEMTVEKEEEKEEVVADEEDEETEEEEITQEEITQEETTAEETAVDENSVEETTIEETSVVEEETTVEEMVVEEMVVEEKEYEEEKEEEEEKVAAFHEASEALSASFGDVLALHRKRQEFRMDLEEAKERVSAAVAAMLQKKNAEEEEEEEMKQRRLEAENVAQTMAQKLIERFTQEEKRRFERECEEKLSTLMRKKMAKVELCKAREETLQRFVRSLVSKTTESLAEMKKEAREAAILSVLDTHHKRQQDMEEAYAGAVLCLQSAIRRHLSLRAFAKIRQEAEEEKEREEDRKRVLNVMASAVEVMAAKQREKEKAAVREQREAVMEKMVDSFVTRITKQKEEEKKERQKKKDLEAARKRRESIEAAKARVQALQRQRQEERARKQKQLDEELQCFAEKGGSTLRAATASYVATVAPMASPVLESAPKQETSTGVSSTAVQTVSVPAVKSTAGRTLREQTHQKLALLREQRKQRMEAAVAKQSASGSSSTTEKLKEITEHWSKKVDSITSKRPAANAANSEKEKNLAETKQRLEKIRSERMALQEKLKRTAKCRMSITTPMADVTNSYSTPTKAGESDRCASIVWADNTPTNTHTLEQNTPEKFHSPGFALVPSTASILKRAGAK
mmetsp:Transcript_3439/g.12089  ORF Transcript_3439/g.12089 Transcript_3439/m.12089 type:complete len:905 (+) Transcript_3439:105-2819(+)